MKDNLIKKIIACIVLLLVVNVLTNYRFFYNFLYRGPERIYNAEDYKKDDTYYIDDINQDVTVIQVCYKGNPLFLTANFTSDDFKYFVHLNDRYELDSFDFEKNNSLIFIDSSKDIHELLLYVQNPVLTQIILNPKISYYLNGRATLTIFTFILSLYYIFHKKDKLGENKSQNYRTVVLLLVLTLLSVNLVKERGSDEQDYLYHWYMDAIMEGHLDLDLKIEDNLINSDNPYDTSSRNFKHPWDISYYNGKYYSYFGILPGLLFLIPSKLISGSYLSNNAMTLIYAVLCFITGYLLYKEIMKKYFKDISYNYFALTFLYIIFGSKIIWSIHRPVFYEYIALSGLFHVLLGLYLVLFNHKKNIIRDILGYTSLALTALCRPTFLIMSIFIIPKLFKRYKEKDFKIKDILALILPYGIIGLITMYLNYIRFGSIFEFGITYQLTISNLHGMKFSLLKALIGSFYYLFEGIQIKLLPFEMSGVASNFPIIADFYVEAVGGGLFTTSLLCIFIPYLLFMIKDKELKLNCILSLIVGIILLLLSSGISSLIGRYMLDFNYLFYFVAVVGILSIFKHENSTHFSRLIAITMIISILMNYFLAYSNL